MTRDDHQETPHVPMRTCAGCRARQPQSVLVRVAVQGHGQGQGGKLAIDLRRRLAGRGVYLHSDLACFDRAMNRGGLARGLRLQPSAEDLATLRIDFSELVHKSLASRQPANQLNHLRTTLTNTDTESTKRSPHTSSSALLPRRDDGNSLPSNGSMRPETQSFEAFEASEVFVEAQHARGQ